MQRSWCTTLDGVNRHAYDNAMAESFFSTLEAELLSRRWFAFKAQARTACSSYINGWCNPASLQTTHEIGATSQFELPIMLATGAHFSI